MKLSFLPEEERVRQHDCREEEHSGSRFFHAAGEEFQERVGDDTAEDTARDTAEERDSRENQECRDGFRFVLPVDMCEASSHQNSDEDQSGSRDGETAGDGEDQRREKDAHEEKHADRHGRQSGPSSRFHAGSAFDVRRDRGVSAKRPEHRPQCVRKKDPVHARDRSVFFHESRLMAHADDRPERVENVHEEQNENERNQVFQICPDARKIHLSRDFHRISRHSENSGDLQSSESHCHERRDCHADQDCTGDFPNLQRPGKAEISRGTR